jgi:hypothetical protein
MIIETFVALYNGYMWYFCYCGAGKLLPRVANHVRGCWAGGVLPRGCSRVITNRLLVLEPHYFEFDFQFTMKYFRTLRALMQADGIPENRRS